MAGFEKVDFVQRVVVSIQIVPYVSHLALPPAPQRGRRPVKARASAVRRIGVSMKWGPARHIAASTTRAQVRNIRLMTALVRNTVARKEVVRTMQPTNLRTAME